MKHSVALEGVICPLVTPFDEEGRIDDSSLRQVIDFLIENEIDGLMAGGTTGEGMLLSLSERMSLCEMVVDHVNGRVPVIAHTGCISTAETIALTRHAESAGVSATSAIVPYFFTFDDESLFQHFVAAANAAPELPMLLYAFPGNAKNDISHVLLGRLLGATDNIVGIKSSNPDLLRFQEYVRTGGPEFSAIYGVDELMLPALALGARGQISGNANVFPEVPKALYDAFKTGDLAQARRQQQMVNRICTTLRGGMHPAYFKAGLRLRGVPAGFVRPPMRELSPGEQAELGEQMKQLGPVV